MVGGVCVNTGTIPSKTLREAVIYLTGLSMRELYGQSYRVKRDITVQDLLARTHHVIGREIEVVRSQLFRNHVDLVIGTARFTSAHSVVVEGSGGGRTIGAPNTTARTGTRPARPGPSPSDEERGVDSDGALRRDR